MIIIRFLRIVFGIYAFLVFLTTLFIFPLLYAGIFLTLPEKKAPHYAHQILSRTWAYVLHTLFLQPIKVKNREVIKRNKSYIFVANHRSQLDIPLYACACQNTFRFLSKAELAKIPLMGYVIRKLYITVNRSDHQDRNKSIDAMRRSLDEGISVFLCPEGTRNRKEEPPVAEFRDGAFRLAILTKTPLAVLTVYNTGEKLHPNRPLEMSPGTIYAEWAEPIDTSAMTIDDVPALRERVHALMTENIRRYRKK